MARRHPKNRRSPQRSKAKSKSLHSDRAPEGRLRSSDSRPDSKRTEGKNNQSSQSGERSGHHGRKRNGEPSRRSERGGDRHNRFSGRGQSFQQHQSPEAIRNSFEKLLADRLNPSGWTALADRFRERVKNSDWSEPERPTDNAVSLPVSAKQKSFQGTRVESKSSTLTSPLPRNSHKVSPTPSPQMPQLGSFEPSRSYKSGGGASARSDHKPQTAQPSASVPVPQSTPDRGFALARSKLAGQTVSVELKAKAIQPSKESAVHEKHEAPKEMLQSSGLQLDSWQAEALNALLNGANVVVDAPTSAGKTRVIEALLDAKLSEGLRLIYTSPVKSLSNDKYREFCEKYGKERVGINTGDFKENLRAPIILATLETYRNSLLGVEPDMRRRVVVYDEYHYLQDESRGSAWEESLILTPKESQVILLSASVPNADEFAQWLETLFDKPSKLVRVTKRPVPLADAVFTSYGWIYGPDLALRPDETALIRRQIKMDRANRRRRDKARFDELIDPVKAALELNLGPVVVYAGRRADVEAIAHVLARGVPTPSDLNAHQALENRISNLPGWEYVPLDLQRMIRRHGIAFHHSGLIPPGRVAIETLLKEGLLRICSGTMGISLGVNFAVRSALISDLSRPSEGGETKYGASEVMQMLGRAGRRGKDSHGFSLWMNLGRFAEQKPHGREVCRSSLKFDPTTVLGILGQKESLAYLSFFYRKSFFMRGRDPQQVMVVDHDLISASLYKDHKIEMLACDDIPGTYKKYHKGQHRSQIPCTRCPARLPCHSILAQSGQSMLQRIITHLRVIGAIEGQVPTVMGQLARHFPQAGGLIIARKLASGEINSGNLRQYLQMMASFCSAHFKEIPDGRADIHFLSGLEIPDEIAKHYPEDLFPELYDEIGFRRDEGNGPKVFREFNMGAASIVSAWVDDFVSWDDLVSEHSGKHFSAGDCMMVLFRFATFLQSLARLEEFDAELAQQARALIPIVLRDPLDARNRMLSEETDEFESEDALPDAQKPDQEELVDDSGALS